MSSINNLLLRVLVSINVSGNDFQMNFVERNNNNKVKERLKNGAYFFSFTLLEDNLGIEVAVTWM